MSARLKQALAEVDAALTDFQAKKEQKVSAYGKKTPPKKAEASKGKTSEKKAAEKEPVKKAATKKPVDAKTRTKLKASSAPNLRKLNRLITRGLLTKDTFVLALMEAFKMGKVPLQLSQKMTTFALEAVDMASDDVLDVGDLKPGRLLPRSKIQQREDVAAEEAPVAASAKEPTPKETPKSPVKAPVKGNLVSDQDIQDIFKVAAKESDVDVMKLCKEALKGNMTARRKIATAVKAAA